eukprot:9874417-Alexandrium_andersonii.AAC.1
MRTLVRTHAHATCHTCQVQVASPPCDVEVLSVSQPGMLPFICKRALLQELSAARPMEHHRVLPSKDT